MTSTSHNNRTFTPLAKLLHWLMAALWITVWFIGYIAVTWRTELNPEHGLTIAHKALASTLLFLIVLRTVWRLTHPAPALPDTMSGFMKNIAHATHFILYALALIALPVSGWLWSSVADKPIMVLWTFHLPPLTTPHPELYDLMKNIHVTLAFSMGALVAGHILVALKHAVVDRDGVMSSMLPKIFSRRRNR
ncbi:Cytochrome b561 homolog 2 [Serratia ficaria]|uniref:cytochrome b n=1 Tax=Enterobacterales TaxID=91347 RepID=UPI000F7FA197|nr:MULTISPECIES: cytochrome b [Enterobacterales]RSV89043.1 cytochrome b [Klebsiella aerogenes]CAI1805779.1 Cytochrome b561 homolog 2 [Serratia ficaria]